MQNIGTLIRSVRHRLGYSQSEIAERANVSVPTLRGCENDSSTITNMMKIVKALDHRLIWAGIKENDVSGTLSRRRRSRGISQRKMADLVDVTPPTILALETKFTGRMETLQKVLHRLSLAPRLIKSDDLGELNGTSHLLPDAVLDLLVGSDISDNLYEPSFVVGSASSVLKEFPSNSIDCVVTSPPYFGLREYDAGEGLGEEKKLDDFINNLLVITKELHRLLKPRGSLWLNIGDSYSKKHQLGVPWRLAFKMIDQQGWIMRNSNVWHKKRASMDNANDRLPNRHEMMFHLVKQADYHYDADAIRLPPKKSRLRDGERVTATGISYNSYADQIASSVDLRGDEKNTALRELESIFEEIKCGDLNDFRMVLRGTHRTTHSDASSRAILLKNDGFYFLRYDPRGALPSDVWDIAPESTRGRDMHYAAYPEELCRIPILATCPVGGIVLDPFSGTGTTSLVAKKLGRRSIGIDLSEKYVTYAKSRCLQHRFQILKWPNAETNGCQNYHRNC